MKWAAASSESQQSITGRHGHLLVPVMFVCAVAFLAPFDFGLSSKQMKWEKKNTDWKQYDEREGEYEGLGYQLNNNS